MTKTIIKTKKHENNNKSNQLEPTFYIIIPMDYFAIDVNMV